MVPKEGLRPHVCTLCLILDTVPAWGGPPKVAGTPRLRGGEEGMRGSEEGREEGRDEEKAGIEEGEEEDKGQMAGRIFRFETINSLSACSHSVANSVDANSVAVGARCVLSTSEISQNLALLGAEMQAEKVHFGRVDKMSLGNPKSDKVTTLLQLAHRPATTHARSGVADLPYLSVAPCVHRDWCSSRDLPHFWKGLLGGQSYPLE